MSDSKKTPPWQEALIALYSEGGSDVEAAKDLGITFKRFEQMYLEHAAFAELIDNCRTLSHAWWISQARKNLWNKDFNTALWNFNMKNRHAWADKSEVSDGKDPREMDVGKLRSELVKKLPSLLKTMPELSNHLALVETSKRASDE